MRMMLRTNGHSTRGQQGMTMIELMIAMTVLTVGLAALLGLLTSAIASNRSNQLNTGATLAAQAMLETIAAQADGNSVTMTDCAGNVNTIQTAPDTSASAVKVAPSNSVTIPPGTVDFTQSRGGITNGYAIYYVSCGAGGQETTYDLRWNIQTIASGTGYSEKLITVGAAQTSVANSQGKSAGAQFLLPVTLRTISATGN